MRRTSGMRPCQLRLSSAALAMALALVAGAGPARARQAVGATAQAAPAKPILGTVKAISGKNVTLTTDAGADTTVIVQDGARLLRIEPGEKDLKNAAPLELQDLQPGDRILVRGKTAEDGKTILAASVIAMKKADIAQKQLREREEWQKHGIGGLVSSVDTAAASITLATPAGGASKNMIVHISKDTVLRRYAPDSVKFDDAKPAPLEAIKVGDQLRARGAQSADGNDLTASEVVSGSFQNIAGTITAIDSAAGTISLIDLATKKPVTVKISKDSRLRKLPAPMAERIAARFKSSPPDSPAGAAEQKSSPQTGSSSASPAHPPEGSGGAPGGAADLQQAISRMPAATLADLQKGDAVMIVATAGLKEGDVTAITLLAGVEPILQASPKNGQSILSPWSLGSAPSGDAGTP